MQERFSNRKNCFRKIQKRWKKSTQWEIGDERVREKNAITFIVKWIEEKTTSMLLTWDKKSSKDWRINEREWEIVQ